ncbi:MAG TPA: aromatic ring-hydroxylating dioxygenase subunit alpha, partial [Ilumatobacteraceae bacterium]|nr:aromatic ring-hydroxylating dioxygenase subunit alpha [Ilumatobacteraceae bacterium]
MSAAELHVERETPATDGYLADDALIEHLLGHIERGTTDLVADVWREPVANYRSIDRFEAELELLRRSPAPFCPSASVDDPGSFVARTAAGIPLVAVRDRERRVRVFKNSCRHRGTQLVEGTGCAQSLSCPFHGWTYALDGRLRRIPDDYGFPGVDAAEHALVEVPSHERDGLVIVEQAAQDRGMARLDRRSVPTILGDRPYHAIGTSETVVEANWKILVEGFLEGYHLKATHRDTFFPYGYDNINAVEFAGPDARITFPFRRIERLREIPSSERRIDGTLTRVYLMFPNVVIAELSAHVTVVVLEPITVSTTNFITYQVGPLPPTDGADGGRTDATAKDLAFVELGGRE